MASAAVTDAAEDTTTYQNTYMYTQRKTTSTLATHQTQTRKTSP